MGKIIIILVLLIGTLFSGYMDCRARRDRLDDIERRIEKLEQNQ